MKKTLLFICLVFISSFCNGQNGIINTYVHIPAGDIPMDMVIDSLGNIYYSSSYGNVIKKISSAGLVTTFAGTGVAGYSGDGGDAASAQLFGPSAMVIDPSGNIFFSDESNSVIRKISAATNTITTIAGNGVVTYAGDGGPATDASFTSCDGITRDAIGNLYITDQNASVVRKIDTSGIISTFAGIASGGGFAGDGGPATAALFYYPTSITVDIHGNVYVCDNWNNRLRKIDTAGIITTIAGNGIGGYTGDGGPATAAEIRGTSRFVIDGAGNLYLSDGDSTFIRKISSSGIITTIAGNGLGGYSGDGGPAILAELQAPFALAFDKRNNFYFSDVNNFVIRKISNIASTVADSFSIYNTSTCSGIALSTTTNDSAATGLRTYFGDGTADTGILLPGAPGKFASVIHNYPNAGTYTIKEVLTNGSLAIDSADFSYQYLLCNTFAVNYYFDANGNCSKDSSEIYNSFPVTVEIDSNGIAIDTVSVTSGLYYNALGTVGDIYTFRLLSISGGLVPTCSGSGLISDTIQSASYNVNTKNVGLNCSGSSAFDLAENEYSHAAIHNDFITLLVSNAYCTPENATVTLTFSPKYAFSNSYPLPTSVTGNTVTWNLSAVSSATGIQPINCVLSEATTITFGDTVHYHVKVTPISGDADTTNNTSAWFDTVKSSYDPNEMSVTPSGYILPGTTLQYTINFENTGNDTAFNIAVMDTLPDNVNAGSLRILASSNFMNTTTYNAGGRNIVKFDFPRINLPDSSHHNQCNGMVTFYVKTTGGLADGTALFNHAGIFFDDNPVVMTDTVENIISLIHGPDAVCAGSQITLTELAAGGVWSRTNTAATVLPDGTITGISTGMDTISYSVTTRYGTTSASKTVTINAVPAVYMVAGGGSFCAGGAGEAITLSGSDTGFVYQLYNGTSVIGTGMAGTGSALSLGTYTDAGTYTVTATSSTSSCMSNMADSALIIVNPNVIPSVSVAASPGDTLCNGSLATFTASGVNGGSSPIYQWAVNGINTVTGATYSYYPADNDVVSAVLTSNAACASPDTAAVSKTMFVITPTMIPIIEIIASPGYYVSMGQADTLTALVTGAGASPTYQWYLNGIELVATTSATLIREFNDNDSVSCVVTGNGECALSSFNAVRIHVSNTGVPQVAGAGEIQLAPNPNKGTFTIQGPWRGDELVIAEVSDMLGQTLYKNDVTAISGTINAQILLGNNLASGMYLLSLKSASGSKVLHFVVQQ